MINISGFSQMFALLRVSATKQILAVNLLTRSGAKNTEKGQLAFDKMSEAGKLLREALDILKELWQEEIKNKY